MANFAENISNMPMQKKVALMVGAAVTIALLVMVFAWSQKVEYSLLFSNLSAEDSGQIAQKLQELKVPFKATEGGIMVPKEKVYELRMTLAASGLPQGGSVGFELFDKVEFGTTDFVQKLNYRRALQGELARSISALTEVERTRVHIAIPERSLFQSDKYKPKASVLVKLRPGRKLSEDRVQGIVHLVSSSVEGMDTRDVSVVDSTGSMLTKPADDSMGLSSTQLDYQKTVEKELQDRILSILEPVVGQGKVKAQVAATIDFTRREQTEEKYDPESQVVRSEQRSNEKSDSSGKGGVPGVSSNMPEKTATAQPSANSSNSASQNETINYEITKVVSHTTDAAAQVKRITVAVLVDGAYDKKTGTYVPRKDEDIRSYENLVKKAIGFSLERNDEISVANMAFDVVSEEIPEVKRDYVALAMQSIKYLAPFIVVVLFFLMVIRPLMRSVTGGGEAEEAAARYQALSGGGGGAVGMQLAGEAQLPELESDSVKVGGVKGQVLDWVEKNPKKAADLVRGWLDDKSK